MSPSDRGVAYVVVPFRVRASRALWWPISVYRYHRAGLSWRSAWRVTHWQIWYDRVTNDKSASARQPS